MIAVGVAAWAALVLAISWSWHHLREQDREEMRAAELERLRGIALDLERESQRRQLDGVLRALAKLPPGIRLYRLDGVKLVPIRDLPRERILAPPREWGAGLATYATFHWRPGRA